MNVDDRLSPRAVSGFGFVAALFLTGTSSEVFAAQQRRPGMVRSQQRAETRPERQPVRFADLQRLLKPGQSVIVTDESGKDTQGILSDITPSSLTLPRAWRTDLWRNRRHEGHGPRWDLERRANRPRRWCRDCRPGLSRE